MAKTLADISFLELLPESVRDDEKVAAAALALDVELQAVNDLLDLPGLLSRLDELSEPVINMLAWQFHVDVWDADLPIANKRNIVETAIRTHKYYGTPYAVKTALAAILGAATISEWWEYGGDPYYFRVEVDLAARGWSEEEYNRAVMAINATKNVRSWLDVLRLYLSNSSAVPIIGISGALTGGTVTVYPWAVSEITLTDDVPCVGIGGHYIHTTTIYPAS